MTRLALPGLPRASDLRARRCAEGRLRDAYPVSAHDIEIHTPNDSVPQALTRHLAEFADAILRADPQCRRIVLAVTAGDQGSVAGAVAAGFRYVLDVDVPGAELSLLVAEPNWVTDVDVALGTVPGS
jgi:hypothetical protein